VARPERFELPTTWFEAKYSIQLSYGRFFNHTHEIFKGSDYKRIPPKNKPNNFESLVDETKNLVDQNIHKQ
jgi:hypothetical protein